MTIAFKVVSDDMRRPTPVDDLHNALIADQTVAITVPQGMNSTDIQRNMLPALRMWAKRRGWRIRLRTNGTEVIVWREPAP